MSIKKTNFIYTSGKIYGIKYWKLKYEPPPPYSYIFWVLFTIFILWNGKDQNSGYSRSDQQSYNIANRWFYKFNYLNGEAQGKLTAKKDDARLILSSNLEEGTIIFNLYDSRDSLLVAFPANNTKTDTIKYVFNKGERYKIHAIAANAKGYFKFRMK